MARTSEERRVPRVDDELAATCETVKDVHSVPDDAYERIGKTRPNANG